MRSSSRLIPASRVGVALPYRMQAFASDRSIAPTESVDPTAQAVQIAYRKGFEAGRATALAQAAQERLHTGELLAGHERELGRLNDDLAHAVLALAVDLASHITRAQLSLREDAVLPVVRDALDIIRDDATPARLYLNPDDVALVERDIGAELAHRNCALVPDPALTHGECRLEGVNSEVDASHTARWRKALQPLGDSVDWIA